MASDAPPDALFCYGTGIVKICLAAAPTAPFTTSGGTTLIFTTSSSLCAHVVSGGDNYCVIAATTITLGGALAATGSKPLVLLATQSIMTTASIDVASHRGTAETIGAGADPSDCSPGTAPFNSGGGAGGSFTGSGGPGATGAIVGTSTGGIPGNAVTEVTALRGGCPGQDGDGPNKGVRGHGGGGVFLIAGTSITIGGAIIAAGEGGAGGAGNITGGGGGGSGGMIGFDAPTINVNSLLLASGGGGGEGSREGSLNAPGDNGDDPTTQNPAQGGSSDLFAGDGGSGSTPTTGAGGSGMAGSVGNGGSARGGGGGGGGGAGLITAPQAATASFTDASPTVTRTP